MYSGRKCKGSLLIKTEKHKAAYVRKNAFLLFLSSPANEKQKIKTALSL